MDPQCDYPTCQYHYHRGQCGRPNAWVLWLAAHRHFLHSQGVQPHGPGGRYTQHQIRQGYQHAKSGLSDAESDAFRRKACGWARRQARANNRRFTGVADLCAVVVDRPRSFSFNQAWARVFDLARRRKHGGWTTSFGGSFLTVARLEQLADLIDTVFCHGTLLTTLAAHKPVHLHVADGAYSALPGAMATTAHDNGLTFYRPPWDAAVHTLHGGQVDGVACRNKLEMVAHVMAHELVHCIVNALCASEYNAALVNGGHGPPFLRLNKLLFGKTEQRYTCDFDTQCEFVD